MCVYPSKRNPGIGSQTIKWISISYWGRKTSISCLTRVAHYQLANVPWIGNLYFLIFSGYILTFEFSIFWIFWFSISWVLVLYFLNFVFCISWILCFVFLCEEEKRALVVWLERLTANWPMCLESITASSISFLTAAQLHTTH